jgi:hypothetical protein
VKISIDLDGTAFRWPEQFEKLFAALLDARVDVVILTAAAGEYPASERPAVVRGRVEIRLGERIAKECAIICCEEKDKAAICKKLCVDIAIDDKPIFGGGWNGLQFVPFSCAF